MLLDSTAILAHALLERFDMPNIGVYEFDATDLANWGASKHVTVATLDHLVSESESALEKRMPDRFAALKPYDRLRAMQVTRARRKQAIAACQVMPTRCPSTELDSARAFFASRLQDLGKMPDGNPKPRMPDDGDLQTMVTAGALPSGTAVHVLSGDRHFTRYAADILAQWRLQVEPLREWPRLKLQWGV